MPAVDEHVLELFREVAPTVETFAREHDLRIDRYRKGKSAWELRFARQRGGEAAIVLSSREPTGHMVDVTAVWWIDDFAAQTRRVRTEKIGAHYRRDGGPALEQLLEAAFRRIQGWTDADLGQPYGPFRDWARTHTAETFAAEREKLPCH
jgi:hypothetical protein